MYLVVPVSSITRLVDVNFDIIRVELETIRFQISMLVINDVSTFSSTTDSHYSAGGIRVFKTAAAKKETYLLLNLNNRPLVKPFSYRLLNLVGLS